MDEFICTPLHRPKQSSTRNFPAVTEQPSCPSSAGSQTGQVHEGLEMSAPREPLGWRAELQMCWFEAKTV